MSHHLGQTLARNTQHDLTGINLQRVFIVASQQFSFFNCVFSIVFFQLSFSTVCRLIKFDDRNSAQLLVDQEIFVGPIEHFYSLSQYCCPTSHSVTGIEYFYALIREEKKKLSSDHPNMLEKNPCNLQNKRLDGCFQIHTHKFLILIRCLISQFFLYLSMYTTPCFKS